MDLLSDVLQSLRLSGAIFLRGEFAEPWGVSAPQAARMAKLLELDCGPTIILHVVAHGRCWVELESGESEMLRAPGALLMPHGQPLMMLVHDRYD